MSDDQKTQQEPERFTVVKHLERVERECMEAAAQLRHQAEALVTQARNNEHAADDIRKALTLLRPM